MTYKDIEDIQTNITSIEKALKGIRDNSSSEARKVRVGWA